MPPAGCPDVSHRSAPASCPLGAPLPLVCDASPPICLLYAYPPVCLLFASWLSRRRCPCCRTAADSASQLCLDLFFAIWLLQLATPHLSRHRRLSSSSRLCLVTCSLRLSTRCHLITGCVVARRQCADVVAVNAQVSCSHRDCNCRPRRLSPLESPYGFGDYHMEKLITISIRGFDTNGSLGILIWERVPYGNG